jgi:hypothetical protein
MIFPALSEKIRLNDKIAIGVMSLHLEKQEIYNGTNKS